MPRLVKLTDQNLVFEEEVKVDSGSSQQAIIAITGF